MINLSGFLERKSATIGRSVIDVVVLFAYCFLGECIANYLFTFVIASSDKCCE